MAALALFLLLANTASFEDLLRSGLVALGKNDLQGAQERLEAAAKMQPRNPQVWLGLAQTYWKLRQPKLAESAASRAEALGPNDPVVLRGLLLYYYESEAFAKAIEAGDRLVGRQDRADVRGLIAKAYIASNQPQKAIPELEAALRLEPFVESYYFDLGQLLLQTEKFSTALEVLNRGAQRFDKSAQLELARGVALYSLRRFPEAIDSFLRTIQLAPEVPQPYLFLGRMLDQAEAKLPEIVRAFAALARVEPKNFMGSFLYARALIAQSGDSAQVESLLRESIQGKGDYWESHFELGLMLERRHEFAAAAAEIEKAVALNPNDATAHYRLARVYDRLGKAAEADAQRALHAKLSATQRDAARPVLK